MIWQEGEFFPITSNGGGERTVVVVGDCLAFLISVRWRWRRLTAILAFRKISFQTLQNHDYQNQKNMSEVLVNASKLGAKSERPLFDKIPTHSRQLVHLEQSSKGLLLAAAAVPANQNDPYL